MDAILDKLRFDATMATVSTSSDLVGPNSKPQCCKEILAVERAVISQDIPAVDKELRKSRRTSSTHGRPAIFGSSLYLAIMNDDLPMTKFLLEQKAPLSIRHASAVVLNMNSTLPALELLLEHGLELNRPLSWDTPSLLSTVIHDDKLATWLLSHGADPNAASAIGYTPLSAAIRDGSYELITTMLSDPYGGCATLGYSLHHAVRRPYPDCKQVICLLIDSLQSRQIDVRTVLNRVKFSDRPAVFQQRKHLGLGTPLHEAADTGNAEVIRLLLAHRANATIRDSLGRLPRERAAIKGYLNVAETLKRAETGASLWQSYY